MSNRSANLSFDIVASTACGASRAYNQDAFFISQDKCLLIVADGCSRNDPSAAVQASSLAIESIAKHWDEHRPDLSQSTAIQEWLHSSIENANKTLYTELIAKDTIGYCTIAIAVNSDHGSMHIVHVGDARAYAIKQGELKALTEDHTFMNLLKKEAPEKFELITTQRANVCYTPRLMRAVGLSEEIAPEFTSVDLAAGDWLVLCTDGLVESLSDETIAKTLSECSSADEACNKLMQLAKDASAHDDVTLIAARAALQ